MTYILRKQIGDRTEQVEVMQGHEEKRDRLIAAGYELVAEARVIEPASSVAKSTSKDADNAADQRPTR